ncbi:MAG: OB-fold domain-containing protein [Sphingobium sp.]
MSADDHPFWTALSDDRLSLPACAGCERWIWPPQWRCAACGSWDMIWRNVEKRGVIHSLTRTHHPFVPAMAGRTPFTTVLVELPQAGGARLLGQVVDEAEGLAIGTPVIGEIDGGDQPVLRWRRDGGAA